MSRRRDGGAVRSQPALQLVGEQQVGELRLPVRTDPAVAAFPLQVVEMDCGADAVAHAADGDHPRAGDRQQPVEQQARQREVAQMVCAELQFEAVLGGRLGCVHDSGVVDEQVDAVVIGPQLFRGGAHGLQRGQVEFLKLDVGAGSGLGDACRGLLALLEIAHGQHDVRPAGGERGGGFEAKARCWRR